MSSKGLFILKYLFFYLTVYPVGNSEIPTGFIWARYSDPEQLLPAIDIPIGKGISLRAFGINYYSLRW